MLKIDIKKLIKAIESADEQYLDIKNDGVKYLYDNLYIPMSKEDTTLLSKLNFNKFSLEDLAKFEKLYSDITDKDMTAYNISNIVCRISPIPVEIRYI